MRSRAAAAETRTLAGHILMSKNQERNDKLVLEGTTARYQIDESVIWQFAVSELLLVGEWTNDHGPFLDDYFHFFVAGNPPQFFEAPMYSNPDFIKVLGSAIGASLQSALSNSTDHHSEVIWPPSLSGHGLFIYARQLRPKGVWNGLMDRLIPLIHSALTPEVVEYLNRRTTQPAG